MKIKDKLIGRYGTLRKASKETKINYYRLSQIVNGWLIPTLAEVKTLDISETDTASGIFIAKAAARKAREAKCRATTQD